MFPAEVVGDDVESPGAPNVVDPAELEAYYRGLSNDALTEAVREGRRSYRPEAWQVIQAELARRGRSSWPRRVPAFSPKRNTRSLGMAVAFFPALAFTAAAFRMFGVGRGGRGVAFALILGVIVWIGLGAWIDLLMHRLTRRPDRPPHDT